jgi:polysaccharide export outer membrane protein
VTQRRFRKAGKGLTLAAYICVLAFTCAAQQSRIEAYAAPVDTDPGRLETAQRSPVKVSAARSDYVLGPGDQITIRVVDIEEINDKPVAVDLTGHIHLPIVGTIAVSGLTVAQLQAELIRRFSTYVLRPDVSISIAEFRSQPVSVIGAVKNSGVLQVQGRKTIIEMLSLAGGLDATAGSTVEITRRLEWGRIPLQNAADDPTGEFSVAQISLKSLLAAKNPQQNILIKPQDVISVPRAETVYVMGQVQKPGGFPLDSHEEVTVLQALSMAGGLDRAAQARRAKILRVDGHSSRTEVSVDLQKILDGKSSDIAMQPNDILFVPNSLPKKAAIRALEAAVEMGTGVVIWGRY